MDDFWAIVISPFVLLVIGLVIEYWVIQPLKQAREFGNLPVDKRRDWNAASIRALKRFRSQLPSTKGILLHRSLVWVEESDVKRGHSILKIAVSPRQFFWRYWFRDPIIEKRYELVIDRTGDILTSKSLPVERNKDEGKPSKLKSQIKNQTKSHPNPYIAYLYTLVGLLGGTGGLSTAIVFYYSTTTNPSIDTDSGFLFICAVAIIGGMILSLFADIYFQMDQAYAWQRLPLAVIMGIIGGVLGLVILCVGIIALLILLIYFLFFNDTSTNRHATTGSNTSSIDSLESKDEKYRRDKFPDIFKDDK